MSSKGSNGFGNEPINIRGLDVIIDTLYYMLNNYLVGMSLLHCVQRSLLSCVLLQTSKVNEIHGDIRTIRVSPLLMLLMRVYSFALENFCFVPFRFETYMTMPCLVS